MSLCAALLSFGDWYLAFDAECDTIGAGYAQLGGIAADLIWN